MLLFRGEWLGFLTFRFNDDVSDLISLLNLYLFLELLSFDRLIFRFLCTFILGTITMFFITKPSFSIDLLFEWIVVFCLVFLELDLVFGLLLNEINTGSFSLILCLFCDICWSLCTYVLRFYSRRRCANCKIRPFWKLFRRVITRQLVLNQFYLIVFNWNIYMSWPDLQTCLAFIMDLNFSIVWSLGTFCWDFFVTSYSIIICIYYILGARI